MKRVAELHEWSRRDFCVAACVGVAGAALVAGCSSSGSGGGVDASGSPDSGSGSNGGACATSGIDAGDPASFTLNTPVYNSTGRFFVVKDAGGFYALTALCTHQGAVTRVQGSEFFCPRHGATFTFNGAVIGGPVSRPLVHYAVCKLANGHLGVSTSTQVAATVRFTA